MITIQESHLNHNQLITQRYQSQEEILLEALSYRIVDELKHQAELLISEPVFPMELFEVILDQFFRLNSNYLHLLICKSWLQVIKKLERKYPLIVDIASTSQVAMYMTRRGIVYGSGRLNFAIDSAKKKGNVSLRQVLKNAAGGKMFFSMDGIVYCVGENDDFKGKHGAPKLYQVNGLNDIVQVDCFKNRWWADPSTFLFFLTKCGNVLGCGKNYCGQFDIKTKVSWNNKEDFHSTPVLIEGLKDIVQMSSGEEHALFLSRDGQVYGIGRSGCLFGNNFTQLEENLVKINDLNDIVQVECGVDYSLFLNRYGKVFACGKPKFYTPNIVQIAGLEDIVSISAFENHTLFLTKNGDVYGSGCSHNFLPFEENNTRLGVTKIEDLKGIKKIVCGFRHSLFLSKDGKVYGSGKSNDGVLGIATNINQYTVDS